MRYRVALLTLLLNSIAAAAPATQPRDVCELTEAQAYDYAFTEFAAGRQSEAEHLLQDRLEKFPEERKARFLSAVFLRSRFYKREPALEFLKVLRADQTDAYAKAAIAVIQLDGHRNVEPSFAALEKIIDENPQEPLFLWLAGIECREHERNQQGIGYYRKLCKLLKPGGVLVHQTFANLLDETQQYEEALGHREIAVKLEPEPWSYNGMANTLKCLRRYKQATEAYGKAAELEPGDGKNLAQWADNEERAGNLHSAAAKYAAAIANGYNESWAYQSYARVLLRLGRKEQAEALLAQAPADLGQR